MPLGSEPQGSTPKKPQNPESPQGQTCCAVMTVGLQLGGPSVVIVAGVCPAGEPCLTTCLSTQVSSLYFPRRVTGEFFLDVRPPWLPLAR